jgi:molybdopterin-guanine dinucleotide biosynthesis protein MobB
VIASVLSGLDRLLADPAPIAGRRIGFLGHPASITADREPAWHRLARDPGWKLLRLFGPEHGLDGAAQDMEGVTSGLDPSTGLPVTSLYGHDVASLAPSAEQLDGLDAVVVDLVDVGARYYTFLATLGLLLRAAGEAKVAVVVCDRPNPLGGRLVEGPRLDPGIRSFVGLFDTPVVHGLTPAEFARWVVAGERLDVELAVVPMGGWRRSMRWPGTGLPFVPPSPNMPTFETSFVYPGACLVEATNLSEGRGTTRPFEQVGAPFVDGRRLAGRMRELDLPGVAFRPVVFRPTFQKWAGKGCGGVFLEITDPNRFRPFRTGCALLVELARSEGFEWRTDPYEFVSDRPAIDLLTGSPELRTRIAQQRGIEDWPARWEADENRWREERRPFLLYPEEEAERPAIATSASSGATREASSLPPVIAFVGRHDSGKTTLVVRVIRSLVASGLRVGSIKHTPHPVEMDRPGKDSRRHAEAGAIRSLLVTSDTIQRRDRLDRALPLREVIRRHFGDGCVDLVVVEGYKTEDLPKIEVVRGALSGESIRAGDPHLVAVATDEESDFGVPRLPLGDPDAVAAALLRFVGLAVDPEGGE